MKTCLGGILLTGCLLATPLAAEDGLAGWMDQSVAAMDDGRWEEAAALCEKAVERYGKNDPLKRYGGQFGAIYFRKGLCEIKLKRWAAAIESFRICYRDFPAGTPGGNVFQKMALLKSGEAAMAAGDWELAIGQFRKFLAERDPERDAFSPGVFYINLAVCHYRAGRLAEGNENLEIAIRNKRDFPTPDSGIMAGFQVLAETAISRRDEQALLDFIRKNRGDMMSGPPGTSGYAAVFLKLAGDAQATEMTRVAMALYGLVPPDPGPGETRAAQLAGIALIHEAQGNFRGARAAYQVIEMDHSDSINREENLYQLARLSTRVPGATDAPAHARKFLELFPESPRAARVREISVPGESDGRPVVAARVPEKQRAGAAYQEAVSAEEAGRIDAALDAYHIAMTADAGASVEVARQSALRVLAIHKARPEAPGALAEAAAVARLFHLGLGGGMPLPEEFSEFLESPVPE